MAQVIKMKFAAVDIGGTFIKYALLDEQMQILDQKQVVTMALMDAEAFYDYLCEEMLIDGADLIGICAPGIFDDQGIMVTASSGNASIMYQTNVVQEVKNRTGLTTYVINDARAAGLCEWKMGNCRGFDRSACYLIGTGIGGCLMDEHGLIRGSHHFSGEFSYMPVWGRDGKVEQLGNHASMSSLIRAYHALHPYETVDGETICERYLKHEPDAVTCVSHWLQAITMQLITITAVYDPGVICIGGGISRADWFLKELAARYQAGCASFISPMLSFHTEIRSCAFYNEANLIGAAIHARREFYHM